MQTETQGSETVETQTQDRETETKTVDLGSMVSSLKTRLSGGRVWAYVGSLLGGLVSVSANVRHSFIPPEGKPVDWSPETMQVGLSVLGPVFLFICIEQLARIDWPKGFSVWGLKFCAILPVTVVSAFVSYRHMFGLLGYWGEDKFVQWSMPIAVDGIMVLSSVAVYITGPMYAKRLAERLEAVSAKVSVSAVSARKSPVSAPQTPRTSVSVRSAAVKVETSQTGSIQTETPETTVPAPRTATVSSLSDRRQSKGQATAERLEKIMAIEGWLARGGAVSKKEITVVTGITGSQTLTDLRALSIAEAEALASTPQEAPTTVPDDARELVSAI